MSWQLKKNYVEAEILTASPVRLVEITFNVAVNAIEGARECCKKGDILGRGQSVNKAFAALAELTSALDFEAARDLAENYAKLYDYCQRRLLQAHTEQSEPMLFEVESLLRELQEAWQVVAAKQAHVCLTDDEIGAEQLASDGESRYSFVG
ncbi:MAG: flagellar export chaperone FliS [Bryobacteraceae bacterium]